ncbi:MAG TPA: VWA domain-containing protein [Vicinamibacterales bacterium]|nr:VWA domain-containing protein [Vicinamibacterales bacterium]
MRTFAVFGAVVTAAVLSSVPTGARQEPPRPATAQDPAQAVPQAPPVAIQITSPLGRTGMSGAVRIVARVTTRNDDAVLSAVQFFVDGRLVGEDKIAPYAIEWTDANPFEMAEISVQVQDEHGNVARDKIRLKPIDVSQSTSVQSVLLEPQVLDAKGRPVKNLTPENFRVLEDGVLQELDLAKPDTMPATYTLLIDTSGSMRRRIDFVRQAAGKLPSLLRPNDTVVVAPFAKTLGAITGPTRDAATIAGAIDEIKPTGGTAILDCLSSVVDQLDTSEGRHAIVVITDGYDEHSSMKFERALESVKAAGITVYVIGVAGVAGISLEGEDLLRHIAIASGGRAFFPFREEQLPDVHAQIAADVQIRYVLTYTPKNQKLDGKWRAITVETMDPTHVIKARKGYMAPLPPPIKPSIELTIRDANRQFVDVAAEDLVVYEDGVEQKVEVFQEAVAPVSIILVLDESGSMKRAAPMVMESARKFVQSLPDKDKLGVMLFSDKTNMIHDLTTIRVWALDAIRGYSVKGGTALYDAVVEALQRLSRVEGRRAVVVLTDGRDENNPGTGPGSVHTFTDVLNAIRGVDAMVFPIGLGTNLDRAYLERMGELSMGEAYFPAEVTELEVNYQRIIENLRRRYVVSYTSTNDERDGGWRKVEIKSVRDGIVVESRGGYFAPNK